MKIQLYIYDFSIFFDALSIIFSYSIFVSLIELLFSCSCFIYDLFAHNVANIASNFGITCVLSILLEHRLTQLVVLPSLVLQTLILILSGFWLRLTLYTWLFLVASQNSPLASLPYLISRFSLIEANSFII